MNRILISCALLIAFSFSADAYDALQRPTELQYWDAARASNGYTLFGARGTTYLIDMEGRVVHTWPAGTNPHLLDNGDILDASNNDPSGFGGFREVNWNGTLVWQYLESRTNYHPHHDFTRIYNPRLGAYTTLFIANKDLTRDQCIAAGANPATVPATGAQMDVIVEVDMSGSVVWEWWFFDHVVQDFDAAKPNYVGAGRGIADYPGRLNINLPGHPLKADWLHSNALDYNQNLDQIVINSVQGEFYVIDHGGTFIPGDPAASIVRAASGAGDFLYRFGDPARYEQGAKPSILEDWTQSTNGNKQLGGAHHVSWIAPDLPGGGHLLIFDNAQYLSEHTPQSYVLEIDPYLDAGGTNTGGYVNPPAAGYASWIAPPVTEKTPKAMSRQITWSYFSKSNLTLFSHIGCSAQRLPNGNTLITSDTEGHILEVTAAGRVVWEYIVPLTTNGIVLSIGDNLPMVNSIFRAYRYLPNHPAFAGRTLTPGNTIAGRAAVANPYAGSDYEALMRPTELQFWDSSAAYNGYTLLSAGGNAYLIDMTGRVAHSWPGAVDPRLLDNGNLFDSATNVGGAGGFRETDWNGNVAWQYFETRSGYHPHGDFARIYNPKLHAPTTLYLVNKDLTHDLCIAAGCDPAHGPYDGAQIDTIVEVDMQGNVVWEWSFFDHAVQDVDAAKANYVGNGRTIADYPGRINLNLPGRPVRADWLDCNSIDYNQSLDQIVVNSRQGEFYVIDHGNTFLAGNPAGSIALAASRTGDFLYRFGDPARYAQGSPPSVRTNWESATNGNKQIGASGSVRWIPAGRPGAGHFLVFNNNQYLFQRTAQSYVVEINPYLDAAGTDTGSYVNPPAAGYSTWTFDHDTHKSNQLLSKQVVWQYGSVGNLTLFSHFGSSAERLPNGNTLICATAQGYLVEVTAAGQVVWEYISPVTTGGIARSLGDRWPMTNAVPRAARYGADFAGLAGRDLTPGGRITGLGTAYDFDGDGRTDISIFRPSAGQWWYLKSSTGGNAALQFGNGADRLVPGDFTGDGKTDIAVWRPSNGFWYVLRSEDLSFFAFPFGTTGDVPAPADYDGDGKTDAAVFRPSNSTWYIGLSGSGTLIQTFGAAGDVPVAADYDGDGKADIAIYRPSAGEWWIARSAAGLTAFRFGDSADRPVPGDYTGDGKADAAVWRPATGVWFFLRSEDGSYYSFPFGTTDDLPAPGDYDGDGRFDAAVFRPSGSTWFVRRSTAGTLIQQFGAAGDLPVPNAFVR
ncbi:MAG: aryl-sulfate sulfotransferase [Acidobacteria bacterium]|nr:aryl-sulfate sulfotransferase [Acidobacteriota bacterium]